MNLERHAREDGRFDAHFQTVTGWRDGAALERLPGVPRKVKGKLRTALEGRPLAGIPRPDVIWCSSLHGSMPWAWAQNGPLRRPMVFELDWTVCQQEEWAIPYFSRRPRSGLRLRMATMMERLVWFGVSHFSTFSRWAADSLIAQGVDRTRVSVHHPGVNLDDWQPTARQNHFGPLRLLFVGADFERKGGDMLVDVVRSRFAGEVEVDMVTPSQTIDAPGIRVHRAGPNSPELRALFAQADVFVLPSRAECFGIAAVEALASGLPVLMSNVGGSADIVDDEFNGWRIDPTADALAAAIQGVLAQRDRLPAMGRAARASAELKFDGRKNDRAVLDLMEGLLQEQPAQPQHRLEQRI